MHGSLNVKFVLLFFTQASNLFFILNSLFQNRPFVFWLDRFLQNDFPLNLAQASNLLTQLAPCCFRHARNCWPRV